MYEFSISILSDGNKRIVIDSNNPTYILVDDHYILKGLESKMIRVTVVKDTIIVVTDHEDLHSRLSYSMPFVHKKGNVFAISTDGTLLWKIEDIIGDFRCAFTIAYVISEKDREHEEFLYHVKLKKDHDYLVCADALSEYFLIDLTDKQLVKKAGFKC